jgi:hypothetical protein
MKPQSLRETCSSAFIPFCPRLALAQSDKPTLSDDEKAQQVIQRALKSVGGDRYLQVKTDDRSRGSSRAYADGIPQIPQKFVDYVAYPDRERTEFSGGGARLVQTNFKGGAGFMMAPR